MNLVNLLGHKTKTPEPEYFLAVEIHESLIKTALWEIEAGAPQVLSVGSYESWADEESLINGVDASLEQATKTIKAQPRRVIFGLPDSWMDGLKIHTTKTKLLTRLIKELGLEPIGMVAINQAIAHYLRKCEGMPPTSILLEIYTSKIAVSYIYLGEVKATEEVAKSGDLARDVEEGLTRIELENYPARFILTNGGALEDESQQITAYPWQERLPFKHLPKVEVLPVDFSIRAVALTGGTEAVQYLGVEIKEDEISEATNLIVPEETPATMAELGFSYEESPAPSSFSQIVPEITPPIAFSDEEGSNPDYIEPEYAIPQEQVDHDIPQKKAITLKLPTLPKISFPHFSKNRFSWLPLLLIPIFLGLGIAAYLFFGESLITIHFTPQKLNRDLKIAIADTPQSDLPTLIATKKSITGSAHESIPTTGTANVGEKATGTITIANKTPAPIVLKAGTVILNDTGKYSFVLQSAVTVASASSDPIDPISGKATGVQITAIKIGAEYNLLKGAIFSVDNFSKTVTAAVSETDFTGGTSRTVNAVSKIDQDKLLAVATEKIKSQIQAGTQAQDPNSKSLPLSDFQFTKKQFDHGIGEEATTLSLDLSGSVETLNYSQDSLYSLVSGQLKDQIYTGSYITPGSTTVSLNNPVKSGSAYQATATVDASIYPTIDEARLIDYIKGQPTSSIRHFFEPIQGFVDASIKISPPLPLITKILPLRNIKFQLVAQ